MPVADDRAKAVELALSQIEKQFGKGSIVRLGSREALLPISVVSTGSISFDAALGVGGVPRGRVTEVYGPESSGKTTITLQIIAEAQRQGGLAAFVDAEHALDPSYAKKLGVDVDNLLVSQPDSGEQALEITEALVRSGAIDVLVVDSVAALVPKAELDGEMGDSHVGLQARLMSQALRKLTGTVSKSRTALIFINQIREKIGVMFGNPETTTGGRALKFYSSVRIDIRRIAAIKEGDAVTGNRTKVKIVKNKVAAPFREAEFDILYGEGISREGDVLDLAVANNIVEKSGAWYSYSGERIGQGRENTRGFLKENRDIFARMDAELRKKLNIGTHRGRSSGSSARRSGRSQGSGARAARLVALSPAVTASVGFARPEQDRPHRCLLESRSRLEIASRSHATASALLEDVKSVERSSRSCRSIFCWMVVLWACGAFRTRAAWPTSLLRPAPRRW